MRKRAFVLAILISLSVAGAARAHDLRHRVARGEAVVVEVSFADGRPFFFQQYEIYAAAEEAPVQVGRTDRKGRLSFVPEGAGRWRVRVFSADGHGADFSFETDERAEVSGFEPGPETRLSRWVVGVSILFGLFGLLSLFARSRRRA